jgi:hypothetical protein
MINKFVGDKGGLYGRTSCSIYLAPFNLGETEEFLKKVKQIEMNRHQILELYMILGGIPYYLDMLRKDLPLTKNIDNLFFKENANLKTEYEFLFRSLFKDSKNYRKVVEALSEKKKGLTREEIKETTHIKEGGTLTEILSNLTQCDFIREYNAIGKEQRDSLFQLTDLFTLFYLNFVQKGNSQDENFWSNFAFTGDKNSWAGYSFEQVCFHHIKQIKSKLVLIKENFESIYDLIILFVQGKYGNIRESLWTVLSNLKNLDEKKFKEIILNKIDYCVIYSIKNEDLVFLDKDNKDKKDDDNDSIISFYFLFNYLDDNDNSYNLISNL